jgi:hypothetical protein
MPRFTSLFCPHHVTARRNRGNVIFFEDGNAAMNQGHPICAFLNTQSRAGASRRPRAGSEMDTGARARTAHCAPRSGGQNRNTGR